MQSETLGIIAGSGQFPFLVAEGAKAQGLRVVACGFNDNTDPALADAVDAFTMLPLGQLNALIKFFKKNRAARVCMAGAINKPNALDLKPDWRVAKMLLFLAKNKGDDAILRAVANELHKEGLTVVKPDGFVPSLAGPAGVLTHKVPTETAWTDIRQGWEIALQLGTFDIGQCLIIKQGIVAAVEAIEGTDATISRAGKLAGSGCVVIKRSKKGQDERLDLPSIGLQTLKLLQQYEYEGVAYEAGKTLFFDQQASVDFANAHNLFLVGIPEDSEAFFSSVSAK